MGDAWGEKEIAIRARDEAWCEKEEPRTPQNQAEYDRNYLLHELARVRGDLRLVDSILEVHKMSVKEILEKKLGWSPPW